MDRVNNSGNCLQAISFESYSQIEGVGNSAMPKSIKYSAIDCMNHWLKENSHIYIYDIKYVPGARAWDDRFIIFYKEYDI